MKGSTVEKMAEAVEHSQVVLYGISEGYKNSGNCRLEALYAHQIGIKMIPLMLQNK